MNKQAKYFIIFLILITLIVIFNRYNQYILHKNFILEVDTVCDTNSENCFVADCSTVNDPECDNTPYKKVSILDANAPQCLEEHNCETFSCEGISDCSVFYCSLDTLSSGEKCAEKTSN